MSAASPSAQTSTPARDGNQPEQDRAHTVMCEVEPLTQRHDLGCIKIPGRIKFLELSVQRSRRPHNTCRLSRQALSSRLQNRRDGNFQQTAAEGTPTLSDRLRDYSHSESPLQTSLQRATLLQAEPRGLIAGRSTALEWVTAAGVTNEQSQTLGYPAFVPPSGDLLFTLVATEPHLFLALAESCLAGSNR